MDAHGSAFSVCQHFSCCAFPHSAYPRHLRWRLLVHEEGRGARQGCPHAAAAGHRPGMAAPPVQNGSIHPPRCPLRPGARPPGVPEAKGAPTHPGAQPRPPSLRGLPSQRALKTMIPPLNQQGSGGRPLVGQNLLRQLRHGPIAMGAPCLERGTAARGGRRLERTLERAGVFVCVCVCVCACVCV